jgi:hypothetical protein
MNRPNKDWKAFIPDGGINQVISDWHEKQPDRVQTTASPSTLTECPRVVWLRHKKKVPITNKRGWGQLQRLLLGRNFEDKIAEQLEDSGKLLYHWVDYDPGTAAKRDSTGKKTSEYTAWINMKMRCYNLNDRYYSEYGGRGIGVCDRWRNSYDNFIQDMRVKPAKEYSLDRIDNSKDYSPDNCRWASPTTQARNQRPGKNNTSGTRGVYEKDGLWHAHIKTHGIDSYLGRFELLSDAIAARQEAEKQLWKDNVPGESVKFGMGEGLNRLEGTPDLLLQLGDQVAISDAKTSRADSFAYVPINSEDIWQDNLWYHYKLQVTAYYMLCHKNKQWFGDNWRGQDHKYSGVGFPLPEVCHLFSFALDDGIVRREITWKPTKEDFEEVMRYTRRWNAAYQSETMPECVCEAEDAVRFCNYGYEFEFTRTGYKLATNCCKELTV